MRYLQYSLDLDAEIEKQHKKLLAELTPLFDRIRRENNNGAIVYTLLSFVSAHLVDAVQDGFTPKEVLAVLLDGVRSTTKIHKENHFALCDRDPCITGEKLNEFENLLQSTLNTMDKTGKSKK